MKRTALVICLVAITTSVYSQLDPVYALYLNNPLVINPAYAGSNNMLNANLQYRTQWAGMEANPVTVNFNAHVSAVRDLVGVGVQVIQDKLGDQQNTEFNSQYAYKLKLKKFTLSMALQMGFVKYATDPNSLNIRDAGDTYFGQLQETKFNTGAGVMLKNDRIMIGLSAPRLLPATVSQGGQAVELYTQNYYLMGAYVIFISEHLRFKPSTLVRYASNVAPSVDLNGSFTWKQNFTAGVFTRNFRSTGLLAQAVVGKVRLGYLVEVPIAPSSNLVFTSHEVSIGMSLGVFNYHDKAAKTF